MATETSTSPLERARGCLVGLAVGDAVGVTLEFQTRDTYKPLTDMVGGGPFDLASGQWTDDTSMALCLADTLLDKRHVDVQDLSDRFNRWRRDGENSCQGRCFDIGTTTKIALQHAMDTGNPLAGRTAPDSAGNGSIMRLAPVPIFFSCNIEQARLEARLQSRTTHGALECLDACELLAILLAELISTGDFELTLIAEKSDFVMNIERIAQGSFRHKNRAEIQSTGYVVHTLEAALWALHSSDTFEQAILTAVNLGHDSDTVGAVTGQLAGAKYGIESIPARWLERLAWAEHIDTLATQLFLIGTQVQTSAASL